MLSNRRFVPSHLALLFLFIGCSNTALPGRLPDEFAVHADRSEASAKQAEEYARAANEQLRQSEKLLQEARQLLEQSRQAEKNCAALVSRIPKPRVIYRRAPEPKRQEDAKEEKKSDDGAPLYSPSDAPVKVQTPVSK